MVELYIIWVNPNRNLQVSWVHEKFEVGLTQHLTINSRVTDTQPSSIVTVSMNALLNTGRYVTSGTRPSFITSAILVFIAMTMETAFCRTISGYTTKKKLQTNIKNYCQQKKGEGGWVAKHSQHWACNRSLDSKSCTEWKLHLFLISLNFKSSQECIWLQFYRCFTYLFHFIVITIYLLLHFFFSRLISRQLLGKLVERINWKKKKINK